MTSIPDPPNKDRPLRPEPAPPPVTTLLCGATQCLAHEDGSIDPATTTGIYHRDVRIVSQLAVSLDGVRLPLLTAHRTGPGASDQVFALRSDADHSPTVLLHRARRVGTAVVDRYTISAFEDAVAGEFRLAYEHDFLDVLSVKAGVPAPDPTSVETHAGGWTVDVGRFGVTVEASSPDRIADAAFVWDLDIAPGGTWSMTVTHTPRADGRAVAEPDVPVPATLEVTTGDTRWATSVRSATAEREALRIHVPELDLTYLGAGVPWFMALFGRDTLITALGSMIAGTGVGLDVAEALARYQGRDHDPSTAEQPGRILHELRTGGAEVFGVRAGTPYYGTVDASPLFVMLLAELHRWGADEARLRALLPAARAAVAWCLDHGDIDGDGFVEYEPDPDGLKNQGWKDSGDSMVHADGSEATGSIALAEVQGYLYAALLDLAELEQAFGDPEAVDGFRARAAELRERFTARFWLPEQRVLAMALDGEKRPLAVANSNMGHCLWTGILDDEIGGQVADRLAEPDLLNAWGVRTLGSNERAYSPLSYHRGSVWPHDSAIGAAGLARYGRTEAAMRLGDGLLATAERFEWRLPELLGGQDEAEVPFPVPYPVACSPQAWSAAVPLGILRLALSLHPDVPAGRVHLAPRLPEDVELRISGIQIGSGHLDIRVRGTEVEVLSAPPGLEVIIG
jgi:glycogen debranching enzyme